MTFEECKQQKKTMPAMDKSSVLCIVPADDEGQTNLMHAILELAQQKNKDLEGLQRNGEVDALSLKAARGNEFYLSYLSMFENCILFRP